MILQISPIAEPLVIAASVATLGGTAVWCVHTLLDIRDSSRTTAHLLFNKGDDGTPKGLFHAVQDVVTKMDGVVERLEGVEQTCKTTHGVLLKRP